MVEFMAQERPQATVGEMLSDPRNAEPAGGHQEHDEAAVSVEADQTRRFVRCWKRDHDFSSASAIFR
jgi:hypothetical protein